MRNETGPYTSEAPKLVILMLASEVGELATAAARVPQLESDLAFAANGLRDAGVQQEIDKAEILQLEQRVRDLDFQVTQLQRSRRSRK